MGFGKAIKKDGRLEALFNPAFAIRTGMEVDEAFEIVLDHARDSVDKSGTLDEDTEALGIVEQVRHYFEMKKEEIDNG